MRVSGTFNLSASRSWSQSQTRRVQLDCITATAPVTVNLPSIESVLALKGGSVEIVVNDFSGNSAVNNITVVPNAVAGDTIEGVANFVTSSDEETQIFVIGNEQTWVRASAPITAFAPAPNKSVINISSAQILAGSVTAINLTPLAPVGEYYKDALLCFEFTAGSIPYIEGGAGMRYPQISYTDGGETTILELDGLSMVGSVAPDTGVHVVRISDIIAAIGSSRNTQIVLDKLGLNFSTNLSLVNGNGTLKVKVATLTEDFG
jgi:hypothetical protein